MRYLPLFHDLAGAPCLLVGGGQIALRKAELLHAAGAELHVVAPAVDEELRALASSVAERPFAQEDIEGKRLAVAATDDSEVNRAVSALAGEHGIPVNVVDAPELCSVIFPSIIDRGDVVVGLSSGGKSPVLLRLLREQIEALLPERTGALAAFAGRFRHWVRDRVRDPDQRRRFWERYLEGPGAEQVLTGDEVAAERTLKETAEQIEAASGEVYLVGAGPGDPDLLTLRALRLMQRADVVLYDNLVSPEVLARTRRDARRVYVGKRRAFHAVRQQGINEMLCEEALRGQRVLRLKGGDPFVFGRGGEEIESLAEQRIPFHVVPGITAANGCAALAGIPLTHRDLARSVRFVTGHRKSGSLGADWSKGLERADETVVVYMGLDSLQDVCDAFASAGRPLNTPAALVEKGTLPDQRVLVATIADLPAKVAASDVHGPTLVIVGDVVRLHEQLGGSV